MSQPKGSKGKVTIIEIADAAGVSKSTVSLVLTGRGSVKPETRRQVQQAMDRLGYVYNRGAANLRNAQSRIVGLVLNDLSNPFFAEFAIGVEKVLQMAGYVAFMANTAESVVRQDQVMRMMREHGAGGIILCPALDTRPEHLDWAQAADTALLVAIRRLPGAQAGLVVPENVAGGSRITRHLINLGHERVAYLGGMNSMVVRQERHRGFLTAMEAAGHAVDPGLNLESMPTRDGGFSAMGSVLSLSDRPTAVVCYNDVVAIGAMLAAARHGLVVGRDIAIVGFDDTSEARHVSPALTTIAIDAVGLGERAAAMLLKQIADPAAEPETFIGSANLVIRESCGAYQRALAAAG
ncbi:LacI family DNA-binding transcriptional regulator [Bosea sp. NBC_00550]|uniref:LacI family DNA-binding transcriptional regulator n=1 Tax=Bosea sp. NBC_00550 TaxID=2969621 RepID=UPI00222E29A3|nr:LacI family DNA-binding transcriptional regulator [Bosea sp. NBC_00550]UZF90578.1 LacI family transcriptional regulator [Bosea sp. NBC_00550]